jgi:hypothetical protein
MSDSAFLLFFDPVPVAPRHDWTPARQRAFHLLARCRSVTLASLAVGMSRETAYRLRRRRGGESFAAAWDAALAPGPAGDLAPAYDATRAVPIRIGGRVVAVRRHYDDRALFNILRASIARGDFEHLRWRGRAETGSLS